MDRLSCDRMFVAVMDSGTFSGGAKRLGVSSGQASKLVSRLEAELGVRLLNRTTRAVSPTEAGRAYYDRIRSILDELDALDLAIRNQSETPRGQLRISAPHTFGIVELAPALHDFARQYPLIGIDVNFTDRLVNLVDEGFDLAVRVGRPADSSLIARRLYDARLFIVASPEYLAERGVPESPADLTRHDCILDTNFREPERWPLRDATGELRVSLQGRLRYSSAETCLGAAMEGLGLACVPDFVAQAALASGKVRRVMADHEPQPYQIHVLFPHRSYLALKVRVLVEFLVDRYRDRREE